ncbi:MAG: thioredoxin [Lachnospiraceae bacterium]|nr:thioredoxin [Lachnospiraceae bacterium]
MAVIELTTENFETEVSAYQGKVLVDFWASWCPPCKMLAPVVDEVAEEVQDVKICKINVDEQQALAMQFKVASIPTLIVFQDGEEVNRSLGFIPKAAVLELIQ